MIVPGKWNGYYVAVNRYSNLTNLFIIEFVSGLQQPRVDGSPLPVPPFPKVLAEISEGVAQLSWQIYPPTTQWALQEFEGAAKKAIDDLRESERE